jgi:hypothetical protein
VEKPESKVAKPTAAAAKADARRRRLAETLRANLQKRKHQARSRRAAAASSGEPKES